MILSRPHKHHPVATFLVRKLQPQVVGLLDVFFYIQLAKLTKEGKPDYSDVKNKYRFKKVI